MPKLCPNIIFPHQQDFFPIRSVTKSSTARFSHENLVEKFKIFVQDFVPIRTALRGEKGRVQNSNAAEIFQNSGTDEVAPLPNLFVTDFLLLNCMVLLIFKGSPLFPKIDHVLLWKDHRRHYFYFPTMWKRTEVSIP